MVQRLRAQIGSEITLKKVLMCGGQRFTAIGRPFLEYCRVLADVEEHKLTRNVISLFAPYSARNMRWHDMKHAASILRIKEIAYEPEIISEIDKYTGNLCDPATFDLKKPVNDVYWENDEKSNEQHAAALFSAME
jgi:large subunit ribosomal protein L21